MLKSNEKLILSFFKQALGFFRSVRVQVHDNPGTPLTAYMLFNHTLKFRETNAFVLVGVARPFARRILYFFLKAHNVQKATRKIHPAQQKAKIYTACKVKGNLPYSSDLSFYFFMSPKTNSV